MIDWHRVVRRAGPRGRAGRPSTSLGNWLGGSDRQELFGGLAEHRDALGIAEAGRAENVVDRGPGPGERAVCPHDDLAGADLGGQMMQSLRREHQRVVVELPQVLARLLFERDGAALGKSLAALVGPGGIGGQVAAGAAPAPRQGAPDRNRSAPAPTAQQHGRAFPCRWSSPAFSPRSRRRPSLRPFRLKIKLGGQPDASLPICRQMPGMKASASEADRRPNSSGPGAGIYSVAGSERR
jgi:hypothetical protein